MKIKYILFIIIPLLYTSFAFGQKGIVNKGGSFVIESGAYVFVAGGTGADFIHKTNAKIKLDGTIKLTGDWINETSNVNFLGIASDGNVILMGDTTQWIKGNTTTKFGNLILRNSAGVKSGVAQSVQNKLIFESGKLFLNDFDLRIGSGGKITGVNENNYVIADQNGRLIQKVGATGTAFPVGFDGSGGFTPFSIKNTGTPDNYGIRLFRNVLENGIWGLQIADIEHSVKLTWVLDEETPGGSNLSVTGQWNTANEGTAFENSTCGIAYNIGATWNKSKILNPVSIASNNADPKIANEGDWVYLKFTASETLKETPQVLLYSGGEIVTQTSPNVTVAGENYTFSYKVELTDKDGKVGFYITYSDMVGNAGTPVYAVSDASEVIVDKTASFPTAWVIGPTSACAGENISVGIASGTPPWTLEYKKGSDTYHATASNSPLILTAGTDGIGSFTITDVVDSKTVHAKKIGPSETFTVNPLPVVSFEMTKKSYFEEDPAVTLVPNPQVTTSPPGGVFFGPGIITNDATFHPNAAEVGTHSLTYSYTDANGCTNTANETVTVNPGGNWIEFPDERRVFCHYTKSPIIVIGHSLSDGKFRMENEMGNSFDIHLAINEGKFIPNNFSAGKYTIIFYEDTPEEQILKEEEIEIEAVNSPSFFPFENQLCEGEPATILYAKNPEAQDSGTYMISDKATNLFFGFDHLAGSTELKITPSNVVNDPSFSNPKTTYTATYFFTTKNNCNSDTIEQTIIVGSKPVVSFVGLRSNYNKEGPTITLVGNHSPSADENFSGAGVSDGLLYPGLLPVGNTTLTYSYKDPTTACTNETTEIVAIKVPTGNINNLSEFYCNDDSSIVLSYTPTSNSGTFSSSKGGFSSGTSGNTATYHPKEAGTDTIKFTYYEDGTQYVYKETTFIDIIKPPSFDLQEVYCADDTLITIEAQNNNYSGTGSFTVPTNAFKNIGNRKMTFNPKNITPNVQYNITYTYTSNVNNSNCSSSVTKSVTIKPKPELHFVGLHSNYNVEGGVVELKGNYSPQGEFSGQGVANGKFYPNLVGVKTKHPINYSFTYKNSGCSNSITEYVDILKASGTIENLHHVYCYGDSSFEIRYKPDNQSFSGVFSSKKGALTDVRKNSAIYNIKTAGQGVDSVFFTYELDGTKYTLAERIFIDSIGAVDFEVDSLYCSDNPAVTINSRYSHHSGEAYFNEPASGFTNYGNSLLLNPQKVPHDSTSFELKFTYISTLENSGCKSEISKRVNVYPVPDVHFSMDNNYNINTSRVLLKGMPEGGVYNGPGVSGNIFYPEIAGSGYGYEITYLFTDSTTTCSNSITQTINVLEANASIKGINKDNTYCYDGEIDTLSGFAINGIPGGTLSGKGITPIGADKAIFNPAEAGAGEHKITFHYLGLDGQTPFEYTEYIKVDSVGAVSFSGLDAYYCENNEGVQIFGSRGGSGTFFGSGIVSGAGSAWFYPTFAGSEKSPHTITYEYTAASGCKSTASKEVEIIALPKIDFQLKKIYNYEEEAEVLIGTPAGGLFSGRGINSETNTFHPEFAGIGAEINITYTYTDEWGCSSSKVKQTSVENPNGTIFGINFGNVYCYDEKSDTIWAKTKNGLPKGVFSGKGITPLENDNAIFNPQQAGAGEHLITYSYLGEDGLTNFKLQTVITVDSIGEVRFFGLSDEYCADHADLVQLESKTPQGGSGKFSGIKKGLIDAGLTAYLYPNQIPPQTNAYKIVFEYTSNLGCKAYFTDSTKINALPIIDFQFQNNFCANDDTSAFIQGEPWGGVFSGANILNFADGAIFIPDNTIIGENEISYEYKDPNTLCSNSITKTVTVFEVPNVKIQNLSDKYCREDIDIEIQGLVKDKTGFGQFSGNGISADNNDGKAIFNPSDAKVGENSIEYSYIDPNGCQSKIEKIVTVFELPYASIDGLNSTKEYCAYPDAEAVVLHGIHSGGEGIERFFIDSTIIQGGIFKPQDYEGKIKIKYEFTDKNACQQTDVDTVTIFPVPNVKFEEATKCLPDSIEFRDLTTSDKEVESREWDFGDGSISKYTEKINPKHFYSTSGDKIVSLKATTTAGCIAEFSKIIDISKKPNINFYWENECYGDDPIPFFADSDIEIKSWLWEFGDGFSENVQNPTHNFPSEGKYSVSLTAVESQNDCEQKLTQHVFVRPYFNFKNLNNNYTHYYEDFENGKNGWYEEYDKNTSHNSWQLETPNGNTINQAASGDYAWFTALNSKQEQEKSWVSSPCFDFSEMQRPMIKFKLWTAPDNKRNGLVLQYHDAAGWHNVGNIGEGINWFNSSGILGNPGDQLLQQEGWAENQSEGWLDARLRLDFLKGKEKLSFRFAYGAESGGSQNIYDGFAFDDIWIGERQRLVLLENFTNMSSAKCAEIEPKLNNIMEEYYLDAVDLRYHTSFPGEDVFNLQNVEEPSARSLYYGISEVPATVMDGNQYNGTTSGWFDLKAQFEEQSLSDPCFLIELNTKKSTNSIQIQANITALKNKSNTTVYIAVLEKEIHGIAGENGQTEFRNVLKKMLPDAGGRNILNTWNAGETKTFNEFWEYKNVYDTDNLIVVVFVQDEYTKEVYQSVSSDIPLVSSSENQNNLQNTATCYIYPNPVQNKCYINFNKPTKRKQSVKLFDATGKLLKIKTILKGATKVDIDMEKYPYGIYFIQTLNENNSINNFKIIKVN